MTPEEREAAKELAKAGVPLFMAPPDPSASTGYRLPVAWERGARADPDLVDALPRGWALCAVMGRGLDLVDLDPRNSDGADLPDLPPALAVAETPSGGTHRFVLSLGLPSLDGVAPGLDYKGGAPDGTGRGFAFIAPTVRLSKLTGLPTPYRWADPPRAERVGKAMAAANGLPGITYDPLRAAIAARRAQRAEGTPRTVPASVALREWQSALRRLCDDLKRWAASGWGGEAHAGLLAHTTFLARLAPDAAEDAYRDCFAWAGLEPDDADLAKLESALRLNAHLTDVVVPDASFDAQELFWAGGTPVPEAAPDPPKAQGPPDPIGRAEVGPFRFLDEDEAALIPTPDPLIDGLLFRGTKARLFGESTRGKTWVAMDQAACVANGIPWLGRFEVKQGPVLFVAAEGAPSFAPRMRTWGLANGRRCLVRFWPEAVLIGGPHWDAFVQACEREGFVLVVQDTQAAMTVGRREDDNDDAGIVQNAWTQLVLSASAPCSYSIHHTGWAELGRPRGASAMFGGMDTEMRLAEGKHGLVLVTEKQRYSEKLPPVGFRLEAGHGGLVVRAPDEGARIFGDEHDVRVAALVAKVAQYVQTGGRAPTGYRSMRDLLNKELRASADDPVSEALAQDVNRAYKRSIGVYVG